MVLRVRRRTYIEIAQAPGDLLPDGISRIGAGYGVAEEVPAAFWRGQVSGRKACKAGNIAV